VTVILHNTLAEPVSIAFPGQNGVLADGLPATQPVDGGVATGLTPAADEAGGTMTYTFTADHAGTFLYESGTNPEKQVRMGLFGALIVRPPDGPGGERYAYASPDSQFEPTEEFMVLLSEIDPYQHQAVERGKGFNINNYKPRYWLINGRGFPDSIADNGASWLPTQPYGALAEIHGGSYLLRPDLALRWRATSASARANYPFHPHGNNGLVIGRDGHELKGAGGEDLSMEKFDINIGPGQTWDGDLQVVRRRALRRRHQPGAGHGAEPAELRHRHVLLGQPLPGRVGVAADRFGGPQPVR